MPYKVINRNKRLTDNPLFVNSQCYYYKLLRKSQNGNKKETIKAIVGILFQGSLYLIK